MKFITRSKKFLISSSLYKLLILILQTRPQIIDIRLQTLDLRSSGYVFSLQRENVSKTMEQYNLKKNATVRLEVLAKIVKKHPL